MLGFHGISEFSLSEIARPTSDGLVLLGGGPGEPHRKHWEDEYQRSRAAVVQHHAELKLIDNKLAEAEQARKEAREQLKAKKAAKKLAALEATLQEEINRLRMERVWLIRLIDDEEAILVLLLSWPLH